MARLCLPYHLIAYSTVESEGYLTKQGVQKLRSSFAKDIFAQDLLCIYEKQTEHRKQLAFSAEEDMTKERLPPRGYYALLAAGVRNLLM